MSKGIRIYDRLGNRSCFNVDAGLSAVRELVRHFRIVAVGCEEGAMVIHYAPY